MSWLRTDDGFTSHPKFEGWKPAQKWAFLELMHYASRYRTEGVIPDDLALLPRGVDRPLLKLAEDSGWIDRDDQNRMVIHDFHLYNPKDVTAASRMKAYRARNEDRNSHRNFPSNETVSRAQARAVPVPSRPQRELKAEQFSLPDDAALPSTQHLEDEDLPDRSDPVVRLLLVLNDRDDRTEAVLRSIAGRVSEAAFDYTRDEIQRTGGGAGKAVTILKRIAEEGTLASPRDETPAQAPVTMNGSSSGPAYIAGLIRNGVIADLADLEAELTLAGVEDDDRSSLVAQLQLAQQLEGRE